MLLSRVEFEAKHEFIQAKKAHEEAQRRRYELEERLWPRTPVST